jgi:hypothetical protein
VIIAVELLVSSGRFCLLLLNSNRIYERLPHMTEEKSIGREGDGRVDKKCLPSLSRMRTKSSHNKWEKDHQSRVRRAGITRLVRPNGSSKWFVRHSSNQPLRF